MPSSLIVAAIQMISSASLAENLGVATRLISEAADAGGGGAGLSAGVRGLHGAIGAVGGTA
jgi:hypothetical protein